MRIRDALCLDFVREHHARALKGHVHTKRHVHDAACPPPCLPACLPASLPPSVPACVHAHLIGQPNRQPVPIHGYVFHVVPALDAHLSQSQRYVPSCRTINRSQPLAGVLVDINIDSNILIARDDRLGQRLQQTA